MFTSEREPSSTLEQPYGTHSELENMSLNTILFHIFDFDSAFIRWASIGRLSVLREDYHDDDNENDGIVTMQWER